jgi:hypothetical protein
MARSDYTALVTEPAAEYVAATELRRFGLRPYLPELRKRWIPPRGGVLLRRFPLFTRYLLLPIGEADHRAVRHSRGVRRARPILADDRGRPWRCPAAVVDAIKTAESEGEFDEVIANGDRVELTSGVLACISARMCGSPGIKVELLLPLFGGVRATASLAQLARTH